MEYIETRPDITSIDTQYLHTHNDRGQDIKFEDMEIPVG